MRGTARFALLTAATATVIATWATAPTAAVAGTPADTRVNTTAATVEVRGTLLVAQPDRPGSRPAYAVALPDGDLVPVRGALAGARSQSTFTGRLVLPDSVTASLSAQGKKVGAGATLGSTSRTGRSALRLVDHRSLTLRVSGTPTLTRTAQPVTPTAHRQYVAAITDKGALGEDDRGLLGHVRKVGAYWRHQANGAISSIDVPARVTRYKTSVSSKDCGLGDDFFRVLQEAASKFPGIDLSGGSDQLVLFVSPACSSGMVGEGTIGDSFVTGGALIVKAGKTIDGTYAHETGHNYGFEHANVRRSGSSMEYYGAYDVMGFALGGYNQLTALSTPFRVFQGITDAGEIRDVPLGDRSRTVQASVTIRPRSRDAGLRSVRVVDPDTGRVLYLDYRSGAGEDAGAFYAAHGVYLRSGHGPIHYASGVTINAARDGSGVDTFVVDAHGDTSLGAGSSWSDASGDLTVHVRKTRADGADVTVRFTPGR
jgi:hypothetical protein